MQINSHMNNNSLYGINIHIEVVGNNELRLNIQLCLKNKSD